MDAFESGGESEESAAVEAAVSWVVPDEEEQAEETKGGHS